MEKYPFTKCFHPRRIINKYTGDEIEVSCGICKACLLNRARKMTLLCQCEEEEHKYCMFVTLTYADKFLPKAKPVYEKYSDTYRLISCCDRLKEKDCLLGVDECSKYRSGRHYMSTLLAKCKLGGCIGYVSMRDVQNFMKRLRQNLKKYTNEKIRYYAVSEYGPKTFRPHYHFMLFYDKPETQAYMSTALCQSWKFGRIDYSLSRGKCASYVARYVNSNSFIPPIFGCRSCKPFSVHSRYFAVGFYKSKKKEIYENAPYVFVRLGRVLGSKYVEFMPWRSLACTFFPKCKSYHRKSDAELFFSYCLLRQVKKVFGEETFKHMSLVDISEKIIDFHHVLYSSKVPGSDFRCLKNRFGHLFFKRTFIPLIAYFDKSLGLSELEDSGDSLYYCLEDRERMISSVYAELYLSKHFLEFVCDDDSYGERWKKFCMIKEYWKSRDYENMKNWYSHMSDFSREYPTSSLCYFYNNSRIDQPLSKMPAFVNFKCQEENNFEKSIKHRTLNELNGILIGNF